jgi:nitrogen regulatory protein PII-like uncharacterized protein
MRVLKLLKSLLEEKIKNEQFIEIQQYCPDVKGSSIVLGVDESVDERALFLCPVKPESAEEIQSKFEGKFADTRMSIMTLSSEEAQLVGRVRIFF